MADFKNTISKNCSLTEFNADLFETLVDEIIVGGYDNEGKVDPYKITIVLKGGIESSNANGRQSVIMSFVSEAIFFTFLITDEGRKKASVGEIEVSVVFSNKKISTVTPEIIQKKLLFEHKDFMGDKNGKTISRELGIPESTVSSYKSKILK